MSDITQRRYNRIECNIKAQIACDGGDFLPGTINNLSVAEGDIHLCVKLETEAPTVDIGEDCALHLLTEDDPFEYSGKVIRVGATEIVLSVLAMNLQL